MIITNWTARVIVWLAARITPGTLGVTIWPFIFIWPPEMAKRKKLVAHERVHLVQWRRYWIVGFPFVYVYQFLRYGYKNMPLEVEAGPT